MRAAASSAPAAAASPPSAAPTARTRAVAAASAAAAEAAGDVLRQPQRPPRVLPRALSQGSGLRPLRGELANTLQVLRLCNADLQRTRGAEEASPPPQPLRSGNCHVRRRVGHERPAGDPWVVVRLRVLDDGTHLAVLRALRTDQPLGGARRHVPDVDLRLLTLRPNLACSSTSARTKAPRQLCGNLLAGRAVAQALGVRQLGGACLRGRAAVRPAAHGRGLCVARNRPRSRGVRWGTCTACCRIRRLLPHGGRHEHLEVHRRHGGLAGRRRDDLGAALLRLRLGRSLVG
mmetsp:Transcript_95429/g.302873  ORF Transcript_95429/g.302873 Transcript_95429/m.302873 type:complete len:290 (-) Transcript_95429:64-933(-)